MSTINIKDNANIRDCSGTLGEHIMHRLSGGPIKTKIIITNHDTGEVLGEISNKILVPGSMITASKQFGLEYPMIKFPTYNSELFLDRRHADWEDAPDSSGFITCLWCAGDSGCGSSPDDVVVVKNTDRIGITKDILPFRYIEVGENDRDITADEREVYFGRRTFTDDRGVMMRAYYFKKFDTEPQLNIKYLDGTEVTENMWSQTGQDNQAVEIYVEMRLALSRTDFREYFAIKKPDPTVLAEVSTISLVTAWSEKIPDDPDAPLGAPTYYYYQDILPFSKFNFRTEKLDDKTRAIDFNYQIFY